MTHIREPMHLSINSVAHERNEHIRINNWYEYLMGVLEKPCSRAGQGVKLGFDNALEGASPIGKRRL